MNGLRLAALVSALVLVISGCTDDKAAPPPPKPVVWTKVELPAEPVVLTGHGDQLLIGLRDRGAKVVPRLLLQQADGSRQEIRVAAKSPYAFEAVWHSIAYDGERLLALGGAAGGAHSNIRWTVWSGSAKRLTEYPQEFDTFGGQAAGPLYSAIITPAGEALAGAWGSAQTGLDGAVWLPVSSTKWVRQSSAKTPLESVPSLLLSPGYGVAVGNGILLTGSQTRLAPNVVKEEAVMWRSTSINQGWSRIELPELGERSQGNSLSCTTPASCTIAGFADGKLALWQLDGNQGKRLHNVPPIAVGDNAKLPPPVDDGGHLYQVVAEGNKVKVVSGHGDSWTVQESIGQESAGQESSGPAGVVTDATLVGKTLYLIAGPAGQPASLWKTTLS
ncbi:hypothetical protein [Streptomyces sp. SID13031]|uniref:hypothetical protein n=1 Tax=Streptomyces sp. SID13031 TaxID=2706046 RepID=UPI0013C75F88|nr:hypothetical protein [Streptomyces sp. SID13031]NEA33409.1 hypothetical protein [Streptomyces sp. SID13031]